MRFVKMSKSYPSWRKLRVPRSTLPSHPKKEGEEEKGNQEKSSNTKTLDRYRTVLSFIYIHIMYTPNLRSWIALFVLEREYGRFEESSEGGSTGARGSA